MIRPRLIHQMPGRRPIAVTIEKCANDASIQDAGKCLVLLLRRPFRDHFFAFGKTSDAQTFGIGRAATPTGVIRSVFFLE
jgi:hypothetical protein